MRLSIKEAAERLQVSEITVRRRLRAGDLEGEQEQTPQGYRWVVVLPDAVEDDDTPDQSASSPTTQASDPELVTELRGQIIYLKDVLEARKREHDRDRDDWRTELERLHVLMGQQGQTLQALTRTVETLEAGTPLPTPRKEAAVSGQETPPDTPRTLAPPEPLAMADPTPPPLRWWEWVVGLGIVPVLVLALILLIVVVLVLLL